jgi:nitric oxide reductase NorD protein
VSDEAWVHHTAHSEPFSRLEMLASALAGRDIGIDDAGPGALAWTDGTLIYLDGTSAAQVQLMALCVQCALFAAGSLDLAMMRHLQRRPALARRYLALEGRRGSYRSCNPGRRRRRQRHRWTLRWAVQ